jgi:hypothetical protein
VGLQSLPHWQARIILGALWSSLARYYQFMTASSWGVWYDSLTKEEFLATPVRLPNEQTELTHRIDRVVQELQNWTGGEDRMRARLSRKPPVPLIQELDEAVFDLFELPDSERDMVEERLSVAFDMLANGSSAGSIRPVPYIDLTTGTAHQLEMLSGQSPLTVDTLGEMPRYLSTFLRVWNREVAPHGAEFSFHVIRPHKVPIIAVVFQVIERGGCAPSRDDEEVQWREVLTRLVPALHVHESDRVYTEMAVRAVSDKALIVIKRDERRLWTVASAMEDADATMLQLIQLREARASVGEEHIGVSFRPV